MTIIQKNLLDLGVLNTKTIECGLSLLSVSAQMG